MAKSFSLERWWASYTKQQILFSTLALLLAPITVIFALSSFTHLAVFSVLKNIISTTALVDPSLAIAVTFFAGVLCLGFVVAAKLWPQEVVNWGKIERGPPTLAHQQREEATRRPPMRTPSPPPPPIARGAHTQDVTCSAPATSMRKG